MWRLEVLSDNQEIFPSSPNLKSIFWQWQSEVEQSNENQVNQMKIKWRFTKISEAESESGWFQSDCKISLSALSCWQLWSSGKSGQIVNILIWQEPATKLLLDLVKLTNCKNSHLTKYIVYISHLCQIVLNFEYSNLKRHSIYL